jgi:hypothetical protein
MNVCRQCLAAIQSREGEFFVKKLNLDEDSDVRCEWCGEAPDELFEILLDF